MALLPNVASINLTSRNRIDEKRAFDLGLANWETFHSRTSLSNDYFEVFLARPRGTNGSFSFLLKALRPEYCGLKEGLELVERERYVGSFDVQGIIPVVDFAYPRRVSATKASRGFLVYPKFPGDSLGHILRQDDSLRNLTLQRLPNALERIINALGSRGCAFDAIRENQLFVSRNSTSEERESINIMLFDYSNVYRFLTPSLLTEEHGSTKTNNRSFDPTYQLSPDALHRSEVGWDAMNAAAKKLLRVVLVKS